MLQVRDQDNMMVQAIPAGTHKPMVEEDAADQPPADSKAEVEQDLPGVLLATKQCEWEVGAVLLWLFCCVPKVHARCLSLLLQSPPLTVPWLQTLQTLTYYSRLLPVGRPKKRRRTSSVS